MKSYKIYILAAGLAVAASGLASCNEDFAQPPITVPVPDGNVGAGTWEDPLQVWQVHLGNEVYTGGRQANWVTGYIVGCINSDRTNTFSSAVIGEQDSYPKNNNVLLAQYPYDEDEWEKLGYTVNDCVAVQLVSGGCRDFVNLSSHPENFNKQVSLRGVTGEKYMGEYGLRSCYEYNWGDKGRFEEEPKEIEDQYFCDFTASRDISYYKERGWNTFVETGGLTGWYVREYNGVRYLTCSAYYGSATGGPYKMWVVSPALDLDKAEQKTVSFRSQVSRPADGTVLEAYVMRTNNPQTCTPEKLECVVSTSNNVWTSSGDIDLSEYTGVVYIGFLYNAARGGNGNSSDYNLTDFNFGGANPADWVVVDPATLGNYRYAEEIVSGKKYAMVYEDAGVTYVAANISEGATYGRFPAVEVKPENGIFESKKDYAITFTADGDAWQLTDAFQRTFYVDYTSGNLLQLSAVGAMPSKNYLWNVEQVSTSKAETFKISNVTEKSAIEFDPSYGNFNLNKPQYISGRNPQLYELIEDEE